MQRSTDATLRAAPYREEGAQSHRVPITLQAITDEVIGDRVAGPFAAMH